MFWHDIDTESTQPLSRRTAGGRLGLGFQADKVELWRNLPGGVVVIERVQIGALSAHGVLRPLLGGDPSAAANHQAATAVCLAFVCGGLICLELPAAARQHACRATSA